MDDTTTGINANCQFDALSGTKSLWDHTVAETMNLTETGAAAAKVMGRACFQNVTYKAGCCTPTAGTILTTFSSTSASTGALAQQMNGKSELMTFNG